MSKLDELLQGVDVEWLPLGKVCNIFNGFAFDSKKFNNEGIGLPLIRIRDVNTGFSNTYYSGEYSEKFIVNNNDILIGMDGDFTAIRWRHGKALLNQRVCRLQDFKSDIHPQFIYYIVQGELDRIHSKIEGTTVKHLSSRDLSKSIIPIPPIEIQQEIVRVLDDLTSLTNQLTTELETERQNRKKQFEFFREQLFSFEGKELEWNKLGSVADVTKLAGYEFTKHIKYSDEGNIIALRGLNVKGTLDLTNVKYIDGSEFTKLSRSKLYINDMLFTYVGTIGEIALINENDKYYLAPNVSRIRFENSKLLPSFMFYYFKTDFFVRNQINKYLSNSSMKNLTMENIRKFMVPIPPLKEQERIVKLLDQFDATHTAIEEEITKEIKLRTQQYEYYREKLLSFPQN